VEPDMMKKNGFSTIELLMTMIILAIVALIAIPGFSRWLPSYPHKGAGEKIFMIWRP